MNKVILILVIVIVVLIIASGYLMYANNKVPVVKNQQQTVPENLISAIVIQNFSFNPATLTIKVGSTVTWTNADPMPHQIKSTIFNSAVLNNGDTFKFTFSTIGDYDYSCAIHPSMKGKIIVTN